MRLVDLVALAYGNVVAAVEAAIWCGFWRRFSPPAREPEQPRDDAYHLALTAAYFAPFLPLMLLGALSPLDVVRGATMVWLLNDVLWHFYAVHPADWLKWLKFYFNPLDDRAVWYARFGFATAKVSPRRMLIATVIRLAFLAVT